MTAKRRIYREVEEVKKVEEGRGIGRGRITTNDTNSTNGREERLKIFSFLVRVVRVVRG
jgi:hypothetical protein